MRAIVCTKYGPPEVLQLREVEAPSPKDDEVLVRVHAATVMMGDCQFRSLNVPLAWQLLFRAGLGFRRPRRGILGQELAGEVESVGKAVTRFKPGDQVYANTGLRFGAYAEYCCFPESGFLSPKPTNMSYEEAATFPSAGLFVLPNLRMADIREGMKVMVIGAGGTMGTLAVQLARMSGATVAGVDSGPKLEAIRSIGANETIDYTQTDYTKGGESYDVIFDAVGKAPFSGCMQILNDGGVLLLGNPGFTQRVKGGWASRSGSKRVLAGKSAYQVGDLAYLKELVEAGKLTAVIDRRYPLEQTAEAHRYVETGQKIGNVVITI